MITFYSNFINEHQSPFCNEMYEKTNGEFRFIATEPIWEERLQLGFKDKSQQYPYVINSYESQENYLYALELGRTSDVVIIGDAPDEFIKDRMKENKLTFRYCERFFKQGKWRILDPRVLLHHFKMNFRYRNRNLHMLCASAYTASDCRFILSYPNKTYKWGYFIKMNEEPFEKLIHKKNDDRIKILWVSRFVKLKHPEEVIELAKQLKISKIQFSIEMIGVGQLREYYEKMVEQFHLNEYVIFNGPMSPEEVMEHMEQADIFLFTSDRQEGWGAVLNEAMISGCAVVACKEIGSVPYLIEDGVNGFIYDKKEKGSLYKRVKQLIDDEELRRQMQYHAYKTMHEVWNAEVAAERLLHLIDCLKKGRETEYTSGPCSRD